MTIPRHVYLVDDDEAIRHSASFMLKTSGFIVTAFASGIDFLKAANGLGPGCVLLDVRMPDIDGLAVQAELKARGIVLPVIVMTGHGDVTVAVSAMKGGAVDFLEKPFEKLELLAALSDGFARIDQSGHRADRAERAVVRLEALTLREREVLRGLVNGLPNKTIGYDLGISARTVEIYRAHLMTKLEVRSLAEVLRIAFAAGWS
ncbi:response regulator [Sphingomonas sp.]|uniref:response regulator transcription factor n=1 Tax=Sphingomonas sp. TaxID=28214 RepID=UPI0025F80168|nr:response regulator [Sphingomonas sp.]